MSRQDELYGYFREACGRFDLSLSHNEISKFFEYKDLLISWNKKTNLTSITDDAGILLRHFVDSLSILPFIGAGASVIDVGTGAGFPGLPIRIVRDDVLVTLLDSLNKRIAFLREVVDRLELSRVELLCERAEAAGRMECYREQYDFSVSRAVAPLNVLAEYCLPFVKTGGSFLAMKGGDAEAETNSAFRAIELLGGRIKKTNRFSLDGKNNFRTVIEIVKESGTPPNYPRREGRPSKRPL